FRIWDTPCPPLLEHSLIDPAILPQPCLLGTIQTRICIGMTFFIACNSIYAIHSHTNTQPFARSTLMTLAPRRRDEVAWVYVPIQGDIAEFWLNADRRQCFLFRLGPVRDAFIGPYIMQLSNFVLVKRPLTLTYRKNGPMPISFLGAYSEEHRLQITTPPPTKYSPPPSLRNPYFSSASLKHASRVRIFYLPGTKLCRGLIIQYEDGQRALGQCRVGIDLVAEYTRPHAGTTRRVPGRPFHLL
ncbi:hypothetical protein TOPH_00723, partial [Tolypocladium ophioglossoides CBS 100239]